MRSYVRVGAIFVLVVASTLHAQEPALLPSNILNLSPPDEIIPAQFTRPQSPNINPNNSVMPAGAFSQAVASPVVDIDLILPRSAASTGLVPVKIVVRNRSQADAFNVMVRVPWSRMKQSTIDTPEPQPASTATPADMNARWRFPSLRAGESKTISFDLKPDAAIVGTGDMNVKAFVSFEHGVEAVTRFGTAKLEIQKVAPKEHPAGEALPVSIQFRNTGSAALHDLKIVETIPQGCQFAEGTTGEEGENKTVQRVWKLPVLAAGETRSVGYRLTTAATTGEIMTMTAVTTKEGEQKTKDAITKIVRAGLAVTLKGDAEVAPGERTTYTIKVVNSGDMVQRNINVTGSVPENCKVTKMTNGGRLGRDRVDWVIPELKGGATYELRYAVLAEKTGKASITAFVRDERGKEYSDSKTTSFAASTDLSWESIIDPMAVAVGKTALLTVRVKNTGGEAARGVVLKVELPDQVRKIGSRPRDVKEGGREIIFPTESIPAGASRTYEVEFRGDTAGRGSVVLKLESEALGVNRPLSAEKMIAVTGQ